MRYTKCASTGKKMRTRRDAKNLVATSENVTSYYFCDYCKTYHVSSMSNRLKKFVKICHSNKTIEESVNARLKYLLNKPKF